MDAGFDARLRGETVSFTTDDATLLRSIDDAGSLNAAAQALGRSYAHAHRRLQALEADFGPLVDRQRGGAAGGGSTLTENAHDLLARFDRLSTGYATVAETREAVLDGTVTDRTGELGTVETAAGPLRAIVPPTGDDVQVSIRADAVTLTDPEDTPEPDATSARNRFPGTVAAIDRGEVVSRVTVDVGADTELYALVTQDSMDRLDLAVGRDVVATFKATATHATRARHADTGDDGTGGATGDGSGDVSADGTGAASTGARRD
jgi:molybdate transport system regulatory protein